MDEELHEQVKEEQKERLYKNISPASQCEDRHLTFSSLTLYEKKIFLFEKRFINFIKFFLKWNCYK
jgi:hypothetical protein